MNQAEYASSDLPNLTNFSAASETANDRIATSRLASYLPRVGRMSEQLKQTSAQIESSVMAVCESFQEIALQASGTVSRGQAFLSHGGAGDGASGGFDNLVRRCGDTLVKVLNVTEESTEVSRRAIDRIRQMDAASKKIDSALAELDQIARGNRIMALNARIEAAHAGEKGAGFAVVAVEVASQTERSQAVTARVTDVVVELRELARSTLNDLQQLVDRDAVRVEQCRRDVDSSLSEMRAAHAAMKGVLADMSEDGERLSGEIGLAVRGMQFQDRVSQRIAHVVEDLDTLQTRLSAVVAGDFSGDSADEGFSTYTMSEERVIAGLGVDESSAGDVELF